MKKIWTSVLNKDEKLAQKVMGDCKQYGLEPDGHFWNDNLEKMGWMAPRENILDKDVALWLIVAAKEDFESKDIRFGLSLLSIAVQATRGNGFPTVILYGGGELSEDDLPTPLKHAQVLSPEGGYGPKLVAKANMPFKPAQSDYRMDVYGLPSGLGLWFEVGPAQGHTWNGAMFGASSPGEVNAHGVGPKNELPKGKMILNYPMEGLKINLGEKEYTANAVKNELDENNSYFVRVADVPDSILFGEFSEDDEAEVFVAKLT